MNKTIILLALSVFTGFNFISCQDKRRKPKDQTDSAAVQKNEGFRPNYHFTPKKGWMNDPNGMFYLDGTYHLFFQYYPDGTKWGPMHWGHATSKDMIVWEEKDIALKPDENGYIFSGSAVVDKRNTSGFGSDNNPPIVAIFTYHDMKAEKEGGKQYESQAIAYSLDKGETFTKYKANPVLENPGLKDFRDPKVRWNQNNKKWIMTLAAGNKIMFYSSPNLKDWKLLSSFGEGVGAHGGVWECPDLFPIKTANGEGKWVLLVSINPGGPNGGSATQYFVGDFNGKVFTPDAAMQNLGEKHPYWIDFGKDNYAGVTWANIPANDGRHLFIGWMSNWEYANEVPTKNWRSASTIARELKLKQDGEVYKIYSTPVSEIHKYAEKTTEKASLQVEKGVSITGDTIDLAQAHLTFKIPKLENIKYEFALGNSIGDTLKFGYDDLKEQFFVNRKQSGLTGFSKKFSENIIKAPRTSKENNLSVEILLDRTSIELFYDNGETVMTEIFFPLRPYQTLSGTNTKGFIIENLNIKQLKFN